MAKIDHALERLHDAVLDLVGREMHRQDERWGEQSHPDGTGAGVRPLFAAKVRGGFSSAAELMEAQRSYNDTLASAVPGDLTWTDILLEETFEALAEPPASGALREELVQVAAVACQWVLAIDRRRDAAV